MAKTTPKIRLLSNATTSYLSPVTHRPYLAVIQYDGANFVGWQRQPVGRSVQAEFEAVLERLVGSRVPATGAGRTDSGVHARAGMGTRPNCGGR